MWVVKLGGSLFDSRSLRDWLRALAAGAAPVVLVPGGGPFADQVRAAQRQWRISDRHAHRMALLAMDQFGELCCALNDRWRPFSRVAELQDTQRRAGTWVWLPSCMDPHVEPSWRVTSDSLAAWLAAEIQADGLLIVKSAEVHGTVPLFGADAAGRHSLLDDAFREYLVNLACPVWLMNRKHWQSGRRLIAGRKVEPARRVRMDPAPGEGR